MKYICLFSGISAPSVAFKRLGWECLAYSEIEEFPSAVLEERFPGVPNHGDVTAFDWSVYKGKCDLIIAGSPCQAFSVAGLRQSLGDDRGNLTMALLEVIHSVEPTWVVWENVPGVLSVKDNAFGCFLGGLLGHDSPIPSPEGIGWTNNGVAVGPKRSAAWTILDAQFFGVPQRRRRIFIVSKHLGNGRDCAKVLFVEESVSGDIAEGREEGKRLAPPLTQVAKGSGGIGMSDQELFSQKGDGLITNHDIAECIRSGGNGGVPSSRGENVVASTSGAGFWREGEVTLRGREQDSHENLVVDPNDRIAPTLDSHYASKFGIENQHIDNGAGLFVMEEKYAGNAEGGAEEFPFLTAQNLKAGISNQMPLVSRTVSRKWSKGSGGFAGDEDANLVAEVRPIGFPSTFGQGSDRAEHDLSPTVKVGTGLGIPSPPAVCCAVRTANTGANGHGVANNVSHTIDGAQGQAICFENHPSDSRIREHGDLSPQINARCGTGGNNLPLVAFSKAKRAQSPEDDETWKESAVANTLNSHDVGDIRTTEIVAIQGNLIGRDKGGPEGVGATSEGNMYTLTEGDVHGICIPINTMAATRPQGSDEDAGGNRQTFGVGEPGDPSPTISKAHSQAVAFQLAGDRDDPSVSSSEDKAFSIPANPMSDRNQAVAFTASDRSNKAAWERDVFQTLPAQIPNDSSNLQQGIRMGMQVRRLTPRECERLQGFPDDFTKIHWKGRSPSHCPDGPRYKALGNSMAVPVIHWIGKRILDCS